MYKTYEEPFYNQTFTLEQMAEIYKNLVNKNEYSNFDCWLLDMLRSGVFVFEEV